MDKIKIFLDDEATAQFEELCGNRMYASLSKRYFKELNDFPPSAWGEIYKNEGQDCFKSDHHVVFDIQGKIILNDQGHISAVKITRFRLRHKA